MQSVYFSWVTWTHNALLSGKMRARASSFSDAANCYTFVDLSFLYFRYYNLKNVTTR